MIDPAEKYREELLQAIYLMHYDGAEVEYPEKFKLLCDEAERVKA